VCDGRFAVLIAPSQSPSQDGLAHSVITVEKPASLPLTCTVTNLVPLFSGASWLAVDVGTRAPEQADVGQVALIRVASR